MFIYQNNKLYIRKLNGKLVGVNITPTKIIEVRGTSTVIADKYLALGLNEVKAKFQLADGNSYRFPTQSKQSPKKTITK